MNNNVIVLIGIIGIILFFVGMWLYWKFIIMGEDKDATINIR